MLSFDETRNKDKLALNTRMKRSSKERRKNQIQVNHWKSGNQNKEFLNQTTVPVSRIKAGYEFFLFSKALRLRYPAIISNNPEPTPPPREAVLPFFRYPKSPPPTNSKPYGIVKQKSCISFQLEFSGEIRFSKSEE